MQKYDVPGGIRIDEAAAEALALAVKTNDVVEFVFNEIPLLMRPIDFPGLAVNDYWAESRRRWATAHREEEQAELEELKAVNRTLHEHLEAARVLLKTEHHAKDLLELLRAIYPHDVTPPHRHEDILNRVKIVRNQIHRKWQVDTASIERFHAMQQPTAAMTFHRLGLEVALTVLHDEFPEIERLPADQKPKCPLCNLEVEHEQLAKHVKACVGSAKEGA